MPPGYLNFFSAIVCIVENLREPEAEARKGKDCMRGGGWEGGRQRLRGSKIMIHDMQCVYTVLALA